MAVHDKRGAKVGPRVAHLVSQSVVATHKALIGTKHKLAMLIFRAISDEISEEVDIVSQNIYASLLEKHGEDGAMAGMLRFMAYNHGQLKAITGAAVGSSGLTWSVSQIMNNELADGVYGIVGSNPHLLPDPGTIAQLAAAGYADTTNAVYNIGAQGISSNWANWMIEAAKSWPTVADALDLLRRDHIDENQFLDAAQKNGVPPEYAQAFLNMKDIPLSPADAALAYLRSDISYQEALSYATAWGTTENDFQVLIGNTGEPLGLEQLLEARRREFIDDATLVRGIKQSRVRNEWIPVAEKLSTTPMSVADAVNAVVQDQLPMATGESIATQNGLEAGQFSILYNTAGEPISRGEMLELFNRGEASEEQVKQAIRESRTKNKYVDLAFLLHTKLPEPRMLASAVEFGSISQADAIGYGIDAGYSPAVAKAIVGEGSARKLQTYRNRVASAAETLFKENAIDQTILQQVLSGLGYTDSEATFIIEATTFDQQARIVNAAITAVRSKYVGHHIDQNTASGYLDSLGVPSAQRDQLLQGWTIEQQANVKTLTEAQIVKAVKLELISSDDGNTRLIALGYSPTDAAILLAGA